MSFPAYLAAFGVGSTELLVILALALLLFGGSKLPSLAKGLGQSVREFKKASKDADDTEVVAPPVTVEKKTEVSKTPGPN